jgi:hypothetical protein
MGERMLRVVGWERKERLDTGRVALLSFVLSNLGQFSALWEL